MENPLIPAGYDIAWTVVLVAFALLVIAALISDRSRGGTARTGDHRGVGADGARAARRRTDRLVRGRPPFRETGRALR